MGFAQVLIQARGEGAAHNGVQDLEREPVGGRARRAHVADPDHGLRRSWFVDQIQGAHRRWRGGGGRGIGRGACRGRGEISGGGGSFKKKKKKIREKWR